MAFEKAYEDLKQKGYADRVMTFEVSSATVELAALAVGTEPERIAKSLTFMVDGGPVMILFAGDVKVANPKFKETFHTKAKMLSREEMGATNILRALNISSLNTLGSSLPPPESSIYPKISMMSPAPNKI